MSSSLRRIPGTMHATNNHGSLDPCRRSAAFRRCTSKSYKGWVPLRQQQGLLHKMSHLLPLASMDPHWAPVRTGRSALRDSVMSLTHTAENLALTSSPLRRDAAAEATTFSVTAAYCQWYRSIAARLRCIQHRKFHDALSPSRGSE